MDDVLSPLIPRGALKSRFGRPGSAPAGWFGANSAPKFHDFEKFEAGQLIGVQVPSGLRQATPRADCGRPPT